jgi:hypothetical protein
VTGVEPIKVIEVKQVESTRSIDRARQAPGGSNCAQIEQRARR